MFDPQNPAHIRATFLYISVYTPADHQVICGMAMQPSGYLAGLGIDTLTKLVLGGLIGVQDGKWYWTHLGQLFVARTSGLRSFIDAVLDEE